MLEVVEYGLDLLKRCLCFAQQNPENLFLAKTTGCNQLFNRSLKLYSVYEQWLVIKAS